jgi:hypothetical protein
VRDTTTCIAATRARMRAAEKRVLDSLDLEVESPD